MQAVKEIHQISESDINFILVYFFEYFKSFDLAIDC